MQVGRKISAGLFVVCGIASLTYGLLFHTATVEVEKERQISVAVPSSLDGALNGESASAEGGNSFRGSSNDGNEGNPFEPSSVPLPPPGLKMEKVTEKYIENLVVSESAITNDVTVGGVVRQANGLLKRTYSGKAPSLCPS